MSPEQAAACLDDWRTLDAFAFACKWLAAGDYHGLVTTAWCACQDPVALALVAMAIDHRRIRVVTAFPHTFISMYDQDRFGSWVFELFSGQWRVAAWSGAAFSPCTPKTVCRTIRLNFNLAWFTREVAGKGPGT